jgi:hypothetical protein
MEHTWEVGNIVSFCERRRQHVISAELLLSAYIEHHLGLTDTLYAFLRTFTKSSEGQPST